MSIYIPVSIVYRSVCDCYCQQHFSGRLNMLRCWTMTVHPGWTHIRAPEHTADNECLKELLWAVHVVGDCGLELEKLFTVSQKSHAAIDTPSKLSTIHFRCYCDRILSFLLVCSTASSLAIRRILCRVLLLWLCEVHTGLSKRRLSQSSAKRTIF